MDFLSREAIKLSTETSKEKAFAFSLEEIEIEINKWFDYDVRTNKLLNKRTKELIQFKEKEDNFDDVERIIFYTLKAMENISKSPKIKLKKYEIMQDVNKVRDVNFKTMLWLAKQPGKTLADKIGAKQKILAPKKEYSMDKRENRICNYYFKKAMKILDDRAKYKKSNFVLKDKFSKIRRELKNSGFYYLDRPTTFEPNNILISDKNYSIINRGLKLLKNHIRNSNYKLEDLLKLINILIVLKLANRIYKFDGCSLINEYLDMEKFNSSDNQKIEFILKELNYYICLEVKEGKILVIVGEIEFDEDRKKVIKNESILYDTLILEINEKTINKKDCRLYVFDYLDYNEKFYTVDSKGIEEFTKNIFNKIQRKIDFKNEKIESFIEKKEIIKKDRCLDFNSVFPYLDDEKIDITSYLETSKEFVGSDEYFYLSDEKQVKGIDEIFNSGEDFDKLSEYLNLINEKERLDYDSKIIYTQQEYITEDLQRGLSSIFNVEFKNSYPIWRSILGIYSIDYNKNWINENDEEIVVLDLNVYNPTYNIIKKIKSKGKVFYEHHLTLIDENDKFKKLSSREFLKSYTHKYCYKNYIKIGKKEVNNIVSSGKLNFLFLDENEKRIILRENEENFYIERDEHIFNKILKEKSYYLNGLLKRDKSLKKKKILIISDYLDEKTLNNKNTQEKVLKEKEIFLEKDILFEKINNNEIIWKEFLPNLTLETIKDGHFYNLSLIKDKSINLKFGEEIIFDVNEKLILSKDTEIFRFPLFSENAINKKLYTLQIESDSFPLEEDLEVSLKIGYYYGKKNPYRVIIEAEGKNFETEWIEDTENFKYKKPKMPENTIEKELVSEILKKLNEDIEYKKFEYLKNNDLRKNKNLELLKNDLRKNKNRLRKYFIKKLDEGNGGEVAELLNNNVIQKLEEYLKSDLEFVTSSELRADLKYEISMFLASFGNEKSKLIADSWDSWKDSGRSFQIQKRTCLYYYSNKNNESLMKKFESLYKKSNYCDYKNKTIENWLIETISEIAWLDKSFMEQIMKNEEETLVRCIKRIKRELIYMNKSFDILYEKKKATKNNKGDNKLYEISNDFIEYLKFILAIFLVEEEKNIFINKKGKLILNKYEIFNILYNIKEIDRKIQLNEKYQDLKEQFDKVLRDTFDIKISDKNGLENVSSLTFTVFNYLTGNDGSDLIEVKIKD